MIGFQGIYRIFFMPGWHRLLLVIIAICHALHFKIRNIGQVLKVMKIVCDNNIFLLLKKKFISHNFKIDFIDGVLTGQAESMFIT